MTHPLHEEDDATFARWGDERGPDFDAEADAILNRMPAFPARVRLPLLPLEDDGPPPAGIGVRLSLVALAAFIGVSLAVTVAELARVPDHAIHFIERTTP